MVQRWMSKKLILALFQAEEKQREGGGTRKFKISGWGRELGVWVWFPSCSASFL